ncbi:hypothetical protein K450DRAFT_255283 [Umbelopsis ramanniana AG]|uniref:Uncharacterized protein n=1 Tax=Umbelopsis ramanniana AG TaxID=1314678 RepID=A0AAD5HAB4_UMBRA|nr:uncharacterized protein K450DRAFT_255283 [Umbelopsis ramanniana AG]KAI8576722.1 hypothetical protein K450DRAFT_255283 [Umbelopsis ramanniana AG]
MVEFGSVDPAALILATLAIAVSAEQLARDSFNRQILQLRKITAYLITSDHGSNSQRHLETLSDAQLLLAIENGLTAVEFICNGSHPASWGILRKFPSSVLMRMQVWCIRRNFGIGAVITSICGWWFGYLLWIYYQIVKTAGCYEWKKGRWWLWSSGGHHSSGYSGKQYDKCIKNLLLQLGWATPKDTIYCIEWIAWLGSRAESEYTGPCTASQIASCQQVTLGAVLCDVALLHNNHDIGKRIFVMIHLGYVEIVNDGQGFEVRFPDVLLGFGINRIIQYYRDCRTKDQKFYDILTSAIFGEVEIPPNLPSVWCDWHEHDGADICNWRGRPILILSGHELKIMAISGNLNQKRCLVVDCIENVQDLLSINASSIDAVVEYDGDIDSCVNRIMNSSFIIFVQKKQTQFI